MTKQEMQAATDRIKDLMTNASRNILVVGKDLIAISEELGHSQFLPWIKREFGMTERTARRFMNAARKVTDASDVPVNGLTRLTDIARRAEPRPVGRPPSEVGDLKKRLRSMTAERDHWKLYATRMAGELASEKILATGVMEQNKKLQTALGAK
jgi:hypothetical protein